MVEKRSSLEILAAIQAEKIPGRYQRLGNYIIDTFESWSEYVDKLVVQLAELKSKKNIEMIAKYHEEHPDFY
jgi:hypothetical protein